MKVEVWCEWASCWLPAAVHRGMRCVWWHNGEVSKEVKVRAPADLAALVRSWGYRRVEAIRADS